MGTFHELYPYNITSLSPSKKKTRSRTIVQLSPIEIHCCRRKEIDNNGIITGKFYRGIVGQACKRRHGTVSPTKRIFIAKETSESVSMHRCANKRRHFAANKWKQKPAAVYYTCKLPIIDRANCHPIFSPFCEGNTRRFSSPNPSSFSFSSRPTRPTAQLLASFCAE